MTERTPKSECTRKIEQDRSILKILTFGQHLRKSQLLEIWRLHNFWVSKEETGPKMEMYSKNWVGQVRFENWLFFLSRSKVHLVKAFSLSLFFFFFFFFFCRQFGPGQICGLVRVKPGRLDKWVKPMEDDVTLSVWRVQRGCSVARVCKRVNRPWQLPVPLVARGSTLQCFWSQNFWAL